MRGAKLSVSLDVPLLQQVCQALVVILDLLVGSYPPEDLAIVLVRRVADLDLVPEPSKERLIHQILRRQVRGKYDQHLKRHLDLAAGM